MRNKLLLAAISAAFMFAVGSSAQSQVSTFQGYSFYNSGSPYGTPGNGSPNNVDGGR